MPEQINPAPRLLMGPGPINADPRVLRAMSAQLLGQFDPQFREYMAETSELLRGVFQTQNRWTLLIDGTARAGIGGMEVPVDACQLDVVTAGLQKCLAGPSGSAPLTLNERAEKRIVRRRHVEEGLRKKDDPPGEGPAIRSNYFDLAMIMDYWS